VTCTVGLDLKGLEVTSNKQTLDGSPVSSEPGKVVAKTITFDTLSCTYMTQSSAASHPPPPPTAPTRAAAADLVQDVREVLHIGPGGGGGMRTSVGMRVAVEYQHAACARVLVRAHIEQVELRASSGLVLEMASLAATLAPALFPTAEGTDVCQDPLPLSTVPRAAGSAGARHLEDIEDDDDDAAHHDTSPNVGVLIVTMDLASVTGTLLLTEHAHNEAALDTAARVRVEIGGLALRHMSCAASEEGLHEERDELAVHLASLLVLASDKSEQRVQARYLTLVKLKACSQASWSWAGDVGNALKVMASEAAASVKGHLLAPIVKSRWVLETCYLWNGWDPVARAFMPLAPPDTINRAADQLAVLMRAALVANITCNSTPNTTCHPATTQGFGASGGSTPTQSHSQWRQGSRHSPSYAGMGVWLERLLRGTSAPTLSALCDLPPLHHRTSWASDAGSNCGGAHASTGAHGSGLGLMEVDVWCGGASLSLDVAPLFRIAHGLPPTIHICSQGVKIEGGRGRGPLHGYHTHTIRVLAGSLQHSVC
jgi:hypothetical protein